MPSHLRRHGFLMQSLCSRFRFLNKSRDMRHVEKESTFGRPRRQVALCLNWPYGVKANRKELRYTYEQGMAKRR